MSGIKRILSALGFVFAMSSTLSAQNALPQAFAGCAGRMSAEMEHAWLMAQDNAERLQADRAAFLSLLEAVSARENAHTLLTYRIETKMAHAALLSSADFGTDRDRAKRARAFAQNHVEICRRLLLGA